MFLPRGRPPRLKWEPLETREKGTYTVPVRNLYGDNVPRDDRCAIAHRVSFVVAEAAFLASVAALEESSVDRTPYYRRRTARPGVASHV